MFCTLMRGLAIASRSAVIVSSHPSLSGVQSDSGLSGSTAWHNSVRARMYFKAVPDAPPGTRSLEIKKNNYGKVSERIIVQWDNGIYTKPRKASAHAQRSDEQKVDHQFLSLMRRFEEQGRNVSDNRSAPNYAPTAFANSAEGKASRLQKPALIEAMERLLEAKQIVVVTEGPPSKRRSRLIASNVASNVVPTTSQPSFDGMGWNGDEESQNDAFQPPNSNVEKDNDSNGSSGPPIPPYTPGVGRPDADALVGASRPPHPGLKGVSRTRLEAGEGWNDHFRVLGDTPAKTRCARCNKTGDVKRICETAAGSKAETLHIDCAEKFFAALRK
jgi:hypothetical protein